jgi:nitrogenase molybdenum-iron protein alpha/beta subunit
MQLVLIFVLSICQDFIIDKLAEFFGREAILAALLKHKARLSDELIERVTNYLQEHKVA